MKAPVPRRNGCQAPFTNESLAAWIGQPVVMILYALVAFGFLSSTPLIITAVLWSVFVTAGLGCWIYCQVADPSVPVPKYFPIPRKDHESRYCAVCKKVVPGIDHHCVWLNTCVGARTYFAFFNLAFFSAATFLWQIISMALLLTVWWTPEVQARGASVFGNKEGLFAVAIVNIALAFPVAGFYSGLFLFHSYLQVFDTTTYGWKMDRAVRSRERRKQATSNLKTASKPTDAKPSQPASPSGVVNRNGEAESGVGIV